MKLGQGHTLLVTGPVEISLTRGSAECFAAKVGLDRWIMIEKLRSVPVLAIDDCVVELRAYYGSSWSEINESTIPLDWAEAAQAMQRQLGVTVIVGDVDAGKSSLCTFLSNICVRRGLTVGIVDGDVGQADIGPPTTISSARTDGPVMLLPELTLESGLFIGDTSPSLVSEKLIRSIVRLKDDLAPSTDLVIVNTDGWVGDFAAVRFKEELLHRIQPDLVLGLGRGDEIRPLLDIVSHVSVRLSSSKCARTRSREERKDAREAGYRRFLQGSTTLRIDPGETTLRVFDEPQQSVLRWDKRFKGFIAGLLDGDERLLGICKIREISDEGALVDTKTLGQKTFLEIGNVALSSNYEEVGYGLLH